MAAPTTSIPERLGAAVRNDVGLLSEGYDVERRRLVNFPQAFSHVGLVNTAGNLSTLPRPLEDRSHGNVLSARRPRRS